MEKRGQLNLFLILGLIILVIIILFFIYRDNLIFSEINARINKENLKIRDYITECVKETSYDSLLYVSKGGYSSNTIAYTNVNGERIPYWYYKGKDYSLSEEEVSSSISSFVNNFLPYCVEDEMYGYQIEKKEPVTWVELKEGSVNVKVYWLVNIKKNNKIDRLNKFEINMPFKMKKIIDVSNSIVDSFVSDPDKICLSCGCEEIEIDGRYAVKCSDSGDCTGCIDSLAAVNDFKVHLKLNKIKNLNDEIIITLEDINSKIKGENYKFTFANLF